MRPLNGFGIDLGSLPTGNITVSWEHINLKNINSLSFGYIGLLEPVMDSRDEDRAGKGYFLRYTLKIPLQESASWRPEYPTGLYFFPQITVTDLEINRAYYEPEQGRQDAGGWALTMGLGYRSPMLGQRTKVYFDGFLSLIGLGYTTYAQTEYLFSHMLFTHPKLDGTFLGTGSSEGGGGYAISAGLMLVVVPRLRR